MKQKIFGMFAIIFIFFLSFYLLFWGNTISMNSKIEYKTIYLDQYTDYVKVKDETSIYKNIGNEFHKSGTISQDFYLELKLDKGVEDGYFKIKDTDEYIYYKDIIKTKKQTLDDSYLNYIPFNQSLTTISKTNFYLDDKLVLSLDKGVTLPILVKENDYYGVVYYNRLLYVKKSECEVKKEEYTTLKHTKGISALVYHFVYDSTNKEEEAACKKSNVTICLSDKKFKEHLSYLKSEGFYTATMKDISLFVDGKIQLPEKTVLITIDDGYFVKAAIKVLEELDLQATLFLIGSAGSVDNYKSDNLEIHSHTYNLHNPGACSGGQGSSLKCLNKDLLLEDLKKSREQLNGSTVFCYPFFEYNDYAINVLKEAGFEMAFIGGRTKIKVGMNKYLLPRYGIINTTTVSDISKIIN